MKKIFIASVMALLVVGQCNSCNAIMPRSEMYLGTFTAGSSYSDMVRTYGKSVDVGHVENDYSARYGNSVQIGYNGTSNKIQSITVTANNGWKTPSGLAVGMNISTALDMYGEPDYKTVGSIKTAYCYFGEISRYNGQAHPNFGFIILFNNGSGKILQLEVDGGSRMSGFGEHYQNSMENMIK